MATGYRGNAFAVFSLALVFLTQALSPVHADGHDVFRGLTGAELERIGKCQTVIRPVGDFRKLALAMPGTFADEVRARVAAIKPNYVTEVVSVIPVQDAAAAGATLRRLASALADPKGFIGIPYWSRQQQKTYDLFDRMDIVSRKPAPGGEVVEVVQHMEPFDDFGALYDYRLEASSAGLASSLRFSGVNLGPIIYSYRNFKAVQPGAMVWELYAFRDGASVVFYGVGAVKAFDLFGAARSRLEASFMGRVEAFFGYMAGEIRKK